MQLLLSAKYLNFKWLHIIINQNTRTHMELLWDILHTPGSLIVNSGVSVLLQSTVLGNTPQLPVLFLSNYKLKEKRKGPFSISLITSQKHACLVLISGSMYLLSVPVHHVDLSETSSGGGHRKCLFVRKLWMAAPNPSQKCQTHWRVEGLLGFRAKWAPTSSCQEPRTAAPWWTGGCSRNSQPSY